MKHQIDGTATEPAIGENRRILFHAELSGVDFGRKQRARLTQIGNYEIGEGIGVGLRPGIKAEVGVHP